MQYFSAAVESYSFLTAETAFAIVYQYMIRTVPVHSRTDRQTEADVDGKNIKHDRVTLHSLCINF